MLVDLILVWLLLIPISVFLQLTRLLLIGHASENGSTVYSNGYLLKVMHFTASTFVRLKIFYTSRRQKLWASPRFSSNLIVYSRNHDTTLKLFSFSKDETPWRVVKLSVTHFDVRWKRDFIQKPVSSANYWSSCHRFKILRDEWLIEFEIFI